MKNTILVIAAHPDDEVYGMGGSIVKFSQRGDDVHLLIVTDGSSSQYSGADNLDEIFAKKKQETEESSKILGIKSITYGNCPDMKLDVTPHVEINKVIEDTIDRIQPNIVYTQFWGDVNRDHQEVFKSTMVAVRPVKGQVVRQVYCYSVPSSTEWSVQNMEHIFMPTVYEEIEDFKEQKYKAIKAYETEIREYPHPRSVEYVSKADEMNGLLVGMKAAESFVLVRELK